MKSSFALLSVVLATASEESCSGGTCPQDESTLLQMQSMRHKFEKTEAATKTSLPGGAEYLGCFVDDGSRDMGSMLGAYNNNDFNTFELCRAACGSSLYMSLQWGGECFCADAYGTADVYTQVADSECSGRDIDPCASNSHNCGGSWRQAIYAINTHFIKDADNTKCPYQHNERLFREPASGSGVITLAGCRAQCEATEGCNHYSHGLWEGAQVCMGCTTLANADTHEGFTSYNLNLWSRVMLGDRAKCNNNVDLVYVDSQEACQSLANANGHAFYSFRHNANDAGHKCFSSERCDVESGLLYGGRTNVWNVFAKSETCTGTYEAEEAGMNGGQVDSNHEGFTGSGFFNYVANFGDHIEWTLESCNGGAATLAFRYALSSGDRPLQVVLNGVEFTNYLSTPATGAWTTYGRATMTVTLAEGTNTVRLVAAGNSGANVDSLIVLDGIPSHTIAAYGDAACPSGTDVTTADECRSAHTALGMEIDPEWNGAHNSIPSACSTREYNWGGQHHFHFDTKAIGSGVARSDLAPVCRVAFTSRSTSDGCLTSNSVDGENPTTAQNDPAATGAVRCCSTAGDTCQTQDLPSSEVGDVFGVDGVFRATQACINSVTFLEAEAICALADRRLCTVGELDAGTCCGTGCWHDHRAIWVSA